MATRIDDRQVLHRAALANLKTVGGEELDNVFGILDKWMGRPFDISLTGAVITLGASAVQYVKSDGADSTTNVQKGGISPISKQYLSFASSTINVSSGAVTGDFATSPQAASVPASQYVWLGFYALADNKIYTTFGLPNAVKANATYPAFPGRPIGMIELQDNGAGSGGSTWNFSSPVVTDAIMFLGGGGGSDGSGSGLGSNLPDLPYLMEWEDSFADDTLVNTGAGYTTAQLDVAASAYKLSYESKTQAGWGIAGASTAITTTSAPAFTVKIGDVILAVFPSSALTAGAGLSGNLLTITTSYFTSDMLGRRVWSSAHAGENAYITQFVSATQVYVSRDIDGTDLSNWSGDPIYVDSKVEVRKITVVATQQSFTIESAFSANLNTCTYACFSQCVHTVDMARYFDSSDSESRSAVMGVGGAQIFGINGGATDTVTHESAARAPAASDIVLDLTGTTWTQSTITSITDANTFVIANSAGMANADQHAILTPQQQYIISYVDGASSSYKPDVAFQAILSADSGAIWAAEYGRVRARNQVGLMSEQVLDAPANAGANFFARFFAYSLEGVSSGTKSFYGYQSWWFREAINAQSGICQQAYGMTSNIGSTNNVNMTVSVVGGKTRITLPWGYVVSANPGKPYGELEVRLNAQELPRYVNATITPGAYYTEVSSTVIDLDQDYSGFAFEIGVVVRYGSSDSSNDNLNRIVALENVVPQGQNFIINGGIDFSQRGAFSSYAEGGGPVYHVDQWADSFAGSPTLVLTRNTLSGPDTPVFPSCQYSWRVAEASSNAHGYMESFQPIEAPSRFYLQTVTLSGYVRATTPYAYLVISTNIGQVRSVVIPSDGVWRRTTVTTTFSTVLSSLKVGLSTYNGGSSIPAVAGQYMEFTGMVLNIGSTASTYQSRPAQQELALCQRHYEKSSNQNTFPSSASGDGQHIAAASNTTLGTKVTFAVQKMATPTVRVWNPVAGTSGFIRRYDSGATTASTEGNIGSSGFWEMATVTVDQLYHFGWEAWSLI